MLGPAMKKTIKKLSSKKIDLSSMRALDIFAREGDWQTRIYAGKVKSLEAWEIDPKFKKGLVKNLPNVKIKITDSMKEIQKKSNFGKFDFIMVDNPQYCYGPKLKYCEHFQVIPQIAKLLDKEGILIFNVNRQPFGFNKLPLWQKNRKKFYSLRDTSKLSIKWLLDFYRKLFSKYGYDTKFCFNVVRGSPDKNNYLHYLVYSLQKK